MTGIVFPSESDQKLIRNVPEREARPFIISLPIKYQEYVKFYFRIFFLVKINVFFLRLDKYQQLSYKIGVAFYDVLEAKMLDFLVVHPEALMECPVGGFHFEVNGI